MYSREVLSFTGFYLVKSKPDATEITQASLYLELSRIIKSLVKSG